MDRLLHDPEHYGSMANAVNPYGDGMAAARTVAAISELLGVGSRLGEYTGG
ncbi:UDP-N-acetylglucosamine 2-epimerase [compost metagenome]